jgi:hypothetical protein
MNPEETLLGGGSATFTTSGVSITLTSSDTICWGDGLSQPDDLIIIQPPDDWTCPACGKVNRADQRACGADEWDGCGGARPDGV